MKISTTNAFTITVTFSIPGEGVDVFRTATFKATFKAVTPEQLEELADQRSDSELLRDVLLGVEGLETDDIDPETNQPFTPVKLAQLNVFAAKAAVSAFIAAINRDVERKNLQKSRRR